MIYRVFQIHLDRNIAFPGSPEFDMYYDATCFPKTEAVKTAWAADMYCLAGLIDAENLDQVFEISNFRHEYADRIGQIADCMHSVSTGDVLINEQNERVYVASFGFEEF